MPTEIIIKILKTILNEKITHFVKNEKKYINFAFSRRGLHTLNTVDSEEKKNWIQYSFLTFFILNFKYTTYILILKNKHIEVQNIIVTCHYILM